MNKEQAQIILANYRPNGADYNDPAFTEALELATKDSSLGEWLANERAQDDLFIESLTVIPIPENLRDEVFEALAAAQSTTCEYSEFDHDFAKSLHNIEAPQGLRDDILAAMSVEQKVTAMPTAEKGSESRKSTSPFFKYGIMAAAAALVISVTFLLMPTESSRTVAAMTPEAIEAEAATFLDSTFYLDQKNPEQKELFSFLSSNQFPSPEKLPEELANLPGVGCKRLEFNNKPASLICFREQKGDPLVHMIVLRKEDIDGEMPSLAEAKNNVSKVKDTDWSVAQWAGDEKAYFLMSLMPPAQLAASL